MPHDASPTVPSRRGRRRSQGPAPRNRRRAAGWLAGAGAVLLAGIAVAAARDVLRPARQGVQAAPPRPSVTPRPERAPAPEPATAAPPVPPRFTVPPQLPEPPVTASRAVDPPPRPVAPARRSAVTDDLTRIEGVGPAMSRALAAAGLRSFAAVAGASEAELREALRASGLRFAPSLPTWSASAARLTGGAELDS